MISVLLPTYNSAAIIRASINSVLQQTYREFELLIVDDGSTDETEIVIKQLADPRIRYIKLQHKGLPETLNAGMQFAKFDIIARMDAGDLCAPNRLHKQLQFLLAHGTNTIISCRYAVFQKNRIRYIVNVPDRTVPIRKRLALHPDFAHSSVMFYKQFIVGNGSYKNVAIEDYDLWLRIKDSANFFIVDEILLFVEHAEGRLSTKDPRKKFADHYSIQRQYYKNLNIEFGIETKDEEMIYRGWREYFYGAKTEARKYWMRLGLSLLKHPRMMLAWVVTYLPDDLFIQFKESRMKFRLIYLLRYYSSSHRKLRQIFLSLDR